MTLEDEIKVFFNEHLERIIENFHKKMEAALLEHKLAEVTYIYISFMRSSILNDLPFYRTDFYEGDILSHDEVFSLDVEDEQLKRFLDELVPVPPQNESQVQHKRNMLDYEKERYCTGESLHEAIVKGIRAGETKVAFRDRDPKLYYGDYLSDYTEI